MFAIPVQLSPRMLYGAPDSLAPTPNKECLKSLGLGLPSTTIGGANEKATSPVSPSAVKSPLSRALQTHKSLFALSPVVFPVYVGGGGGKAAGREKNTPLATLISRKMLSFRQPCCACARPVDVRAEALVVLPCAHIAHASCHDEMALNQRYTDVRVVRERDGALAYERPRRAQEAHGPRAAAVRLLLHVVVVMLPRATPLLPLNDVNPRYAPIPQR